MHKKLILKRQFGGVFNSPPATSFNSFKQIDFSGEGPSWQDYETELVHNLGWITNDQATNMSPKYGKIS